MFNLAFSLPESFHDHKATSRVTIPRVEILATEQVAKAIRLGTIGEAADPVAMPTIRDLVPSLAHRRHRAA
ncbi:hypothetical protein B6S44_22860 [Bosea sp. Tri-44]|nr:hypothetical protein B6S44_22860 [Bosea sp. Tri-44]